MAKIFFSYRKQGEDKPSSLRLADDMRAAFGDKEVFRDEKGLKFGRFEDQLLRAVESSELLVAVIGPTWLSRVEDLRSAQDWVRRELAAGLQRGIPIAPVLVDGARQPSASDLPVELGELFEYQFTTLHAKHWRTDVDELIDSIADYLGIEKRVSGAFQDFAVPELSGEWLTTEGEVIYLNQLGNNLEMTAYLFGQVVGQGRGVLSGNEVRFTLQRVDFGQGSGTGIVSPDGRRISGEVQYGLQRFPVSLSKR